MNYRHKKQAQEAEKRELFNDIRNVFEKRYRKKLCPEDVEEIHRNLTRYAMVCHRIGLQQFDNQLKNAT